MSVQELCEILHNCNQQAVVKISVYIAGGSQDDSGDWENRDVEFVAPDGHKQNTAAEIVLHT